MPHVTLPELMMMPEEIQKKALDQHAFDMRVSEPGIIQSFSPGPPATCTVQPAIRERLNINGNISHVQLPILINVPVIYPGGGGYAITWPLNVGDEGIIVYQDKCYDAFWQSGGIQNQVEKRRHDLSDAVFYPCRISIPNSLTGVTNTFQIRNAAGAAIIEMNGTTINILGGTVNIMNRSFMAHTHSGVQSGGSNTGGVV
jgi:hypothetical protein